MSAVRQWLEAIGLAQYADTFEANDIDMDLLRKVDDQILKDIGVASAGHRLRLRSAIAELIPPLTLEASATTTATVREAAAASAERRQLTVMFCDLVGSTALSVRLDPEDLREVISAYQKCVAETVRRFDGFVAKYMGDGVLVYFGYPQAHEHDAEQAVRAALALIETVHKLRIEEPLQVRIGIGTGLVVVGDLIGSGEAQERGVVGETPNLAARLQAAAAPGTVVIGPTTRRLLAGLFEYSDLGGIDVKGFATPVQVYQVVRPTAVESRFEALRVGTLTPLIGREEETGVLLRRWQRAKQGEGQLVLLSGEPGIGKSRLTAWLLEQIVDEPHTRLRYFCSPQHADSALYPVIGQFERAAGFGHGDDPSSKLDKLEVLLSRTSTRAFDAALFADLLSLPRDRYRPLDLTPQQHRQRTFEALTWQVEALARQRPVLMVFEDVHWVDPTSLEVLGRIIDRIRILRVLLVVTFRPEFDPPWIGQPDVTAVALNRLGQRDVGGMIERIVGNKVLPADILADIIERTDGVPLFVEEMTNAVLEAGETEARQIASAVPSAGHAVPATLHASLMSRLDRLGPAKEVAQIGAAIGREFSYELIAQIFPRSGDELKSALERLREAGLVFRQGVPPHATFLFKHALVQDAAYGTLLREPRHALHARIAKRLTEKFSDTAETRPEILAHHYTQAGLIDEAASFWGKAGRRSMARSALTEAVTQLTRALHQIASLPESAARRREQMHLQAALAGGLMLTKGYSSPDAIAAFEKARAMIEHAESLGESPEDPLLPFSILYGLWVASYISMEMNGLRDRAERFLARAERADASAPLLVGHRLMAVTQLMLGHFRAAHAHAERAVSLHAPDEHRSLAVGFGQDIGATALAYHAYTLWHLGYPEAALNTTDKLVRTARELGHAATSMHALWHVAQVEVWTGQLSAAESRAEEVLALATEKGSQFWQANAMLLKGTIFALTDRAIEAIEVLNLGLDRYRSIGSRVFIPAYVSLLALAYASRGQLDQAKVTFSQALEAMSATGERFWEAEIHRRSGELELMSGNPDLQKVEFRFHRALAIAGAQEAKSWELRAAMSMARLWRDQGKRQQAHDLLAPVYGWFTEGFDTLDLKQAKVLLDELAM